jgi:hypothetical protein
MTIQAVGAAMTEHHLDSARFINRWNVRGHRPYTKGDACDSYDGKTGTGSYDHDSGAGPTALAEQPAPDSAAVVNGTIISIQDVEKAAGTENPRSSKNSIRDRAGAGSESGARCGTGRNRPGSPAVRGSEAQDFRR